MLKLPRPERNGKHFVSYCNKRNKSDNDYSIAQAVFRHMGDILPLSQEQLAAESHQSEASASRFFRRCGFASFWEFKTQMVNFLTQRRLRKTQETLNRYHGMTDREVSRELCRHAVQNLEQTTERMDLAQLARIVELFRQSEQVYFVGDMRELECFYSLQLDLMCKGQAVYHCNFDEVEKDELPAMNEKTVVCIFSVSERYYPEERQMLFQEAKRCHARTVWFTQEGEDADAELTYRYGCAGSRTEGYYSLLLLEKMMIAMLYRSDNA